MYVKEIWRYPVKSMRGERIEQAEIRTTGIVGDRQIVVASVARDALITARSHPGLLGVQAALNQDGVVTVDGLTWNSAAAQDRASDAAGERVQLVDLHDSRDRFDILPLLVATDGAINDLAIDGRRLRPNIVVGDVPDQTERQWPGRTLQAGPVQIRVAQLRGRCVMTTYDPDTLKQDLGVLRKIVQRLGGKTALDCEVVVPGPLRVNDPVEIQPT